MMKPLGKTADAIADTFLQLVMARGYNAVSYADLAKRLGIRTASIHYHFPAKADLAEAVLQRYGEGWAEAMGEPVPGDAQSYREAFGRMLEPVRAMAEVDNASCLFGVLGAEYAALPQCLQAGVRDFFAAQQGALEKLLDEGRKAGAFDFPGSPGDMARLIASSLQGAVMIKKAKGGDMAHIESVLHSLQRMVMAPKQG